MIVKGCILSREGSTFRFVREGTTTPIVIAIRQCHFVVKEGGVLPTRARVSLTSRAIQELGLVALEEKLLNEEGHGSD